MNTTKIGAFKDIKNQIGYCGIWCGSCVAGNGTLQELTHRYKEVTEAYDLKDWAPKDFDFGEFSKGLESIKDMPLCPGCLKEGGSPECGMRLCAREKQLDDCSDCPAPESCAHKEALDKMRSAALEAGLLVKTEKDDSETLIQEWTTKLKTTWPSLILFMDED